MSEDEENEIEVRLAFVESEASRIEELKFELQNARDAVRDLVWVIRALVDDNDLSTSSDVDEILERARVLAGPAGVTKTRDYTGVLWPVRQ